LSDEYPVPKSSIAILIPSFRKRSKRSLWAVGVFGLDRHMHARQMSRQRATIGAALVGTRLCELRVLLILAGLIRMELSALCDAIIESFLAGA
jgi:ABC-type antimicrobial peptide transport system permease subunit